MWSICGSNRFCGTGTAPNTTPQAPTLVLGQKPLPGSSLPIDEGGLTENDAFLSKCFKACDKDNSGYVDVGELQNLLFMLNKPNNNYELWKCMETVDSSPPFGLIDFEEFRLYMAREKPSAHKDEWMTRLQELEGGTGATTSESVIMHHEQGTSIVTEVNVADKYMMGRKLGSGKYASVYLCNTPSGEKYAMKIFHKKDRTKQKMYEVIKEANTMRALLGHPNIAALKDIIETRERVLLVMEYLEGGQLYDEVLRRKHFTEKVAAKIISQLVDALGFCHSKNIIHCDLKPENILCTKGPQNDDYFDIKLTDFGLSKVMVPESSQVLTYCGTPLYMAPEMIRRDKYHTEVDMWSAGCLAHELLCGQPPFGGNTRADLEKNIKGFRGLKRFRKPGLAPGATTSHILNEWRDCNVHEQAQDLIAWMLHHRAEERVTAKQALEHPWLSGTGHVHSDTHMAQTQNKLLTQQVKRKMQRAITKMAIIDKWSYMLDSDKKRNSLRHKIDNVQKNTAKRGNASDCKCVMQ